jgi:type II secretory ATPase GspE/PulE/Tfp pilus assembly ATPase PilB-like protein
MNFWEKMEKTLHKLSVKTDSLSQVLLLDNEALIPHLLDQLNVNDVKKALSSVGIDSFDKKIYENGKVIASSYTYIIIQSNDDVLAFSTNPLCALELFTIRSFCSKVTKVGFVEENNQCLASKTQKVSEIDSKRIVKMLFQKAVDLGVSDIHIEPRNTSHVCFKFRLDGMIVNSEIPDVSNILFQSVAAEINVLFDINIGAYNEIQERQSTTSKIKVLNAQHKSVDLRLELNPLHSKFKEGSQKGKNIPNYVIRLMNPSSFRLLSDIGLTNSQVEEIKGFCRQNNAGIFIAGPTGSGKTMLAYAILAEIRNQQDGISIRTVEDPVEVDLPETPQISIKEGQISFEQALKATLRSDPDVVFCGEIRDKTTAHHVCKTREVGYTIVTTMHVDKSFDVIDRLKDTSSNESFAVPLHTIAKTVSVVIMPRLLRKVCKDCCIKIDAKNDVFYKKYSSYFDNRSTFIKKAKDDGCERCSNTGYKGRTQVVEVLVINNELRKMIINNNSSSVMAEKQPKKKDIYCSAIALVKNGITTLEEITRALPSKR